MEWREKEKIDKKRRMGKGGGGSPWVFYMQFCCFF